MLLSSLYDSLRITLGDEQIAGAWGIEDAMALLYLQQPFKLGQAPPYLSLTQTTLPDDTIDPAPNPTETGLIILKAACNYFGGQRAVTWRTRAASFSEAPRSIEIILRELRIKIQDLEESGGIRDENGKVTGTPLIAGRLDLSTFTTDLASILYGHRILPTSTP